MKGIIKQESKYHPSDTIVNSPSELLILGIEHGYYHVLDESNRLVLLPKDDIEITDHEQPDFWIDDNGRLVPEEWRLENFLLLYEDLYNDWDEIWIVTQYAKAFWKFHLPTIPTNYEKAVDTNYKIDLVNNHLKLASDYDSMVEQHVRWIYTFGPFNNELTYFRWMNGQAEHFKKKLMSDRTLGFDVLKELLTKIGSPFETGKIINDNYFLEGIRNRLLFSIWSLFGTKEFAVYRLIYEKSAYLDYAITWKNETYLLSFDYFT